MGALDAVIGEASGAQRVDIQFQQGAGLGSVRRPQSPTFDSTHVLHRHMIACLFAIPAGHRHGEAVERFPVDPADEMNLDVVAWRCGDRGEQPRLCGRT